MNDHGKIPRIDELGGLSNWSVSRGARVVDCL